MLHAAGHAHAQFPGRLPVTAHRHLYLVPPLPPEEQTKTWTFCGHWEGHRIVVDYVMEGDRAVDPDVVFGSVHHGATLADAEADMRAEYEPEYWGRLHSHFGGLNVRVEDGRRVCNVCQEIE